MKAAPNRVAFMLFQAICMYIVSYSDYLTGAGMHIFKTSVLAVLVSFGFAGNLSAQDIERTLNQHFEHKPVPLTEEGRALHKSMFIMDWHTDTLLWKRNMLERSDIGHADIPRLREGNVGIQMFTTVTKSPEGQNYEENQSEANDTITGLVKLNGWPVETHNSLLQRALYQAQKLDTTILASEGAMSWIKNKRDLHNFLKRREKAGLDKALLPIGAVLGAEGAHALEGNIKNLQTMYDAGFRMIGLTHFFDNELGGSLHGVSNAGLTEFGRAVVRIMDEMNIIIDLAHASEQMAYDVLSITSTPVVVSHTGLKGACDTPRNFSDDLMKEIAKTDGVIAIGFWDAAVCDPTPAGIAKAIKYGVELVGEDHIALGSDWDGATTSITADEIGEVTEELLKLELSNATIRKIMGENSLRVLQQALPD